MELDYKAIGKRIKIARIQKDMTQEKLCERVDLSTSHMSNIETGTTKVSLTTIVNIANALSVTLDDLLCDSLTMATVQFERDISILLNGCTPSELRVISGIVAATKEALRREKNLQDQ